MKLLLLLVALISASYSKAQKTDSLPPRVHELAKLETIKEQTRDRKQVMEGSTTALSYFEVHTTTIEPGRAAHPPHVHNDMEELVIVKEGQLKITIKGESKIVGPGSIGFAMPGDEHGFENAGNTIATYYVLKYKSRLPMELERAKQHGGSFIINWNDLAFNKTEKGGRREFFNKPTSQLQKFEMHTTALNAGLDSHPPHTHKEEEIILILRGKVTMHIGDQFIKAVPGDVVFLSSGIPHALKNTGGEQCEYFAFQWRN
ncbi:MAG: cupin domain-containing protein [Chitinophagaceae bacterium]|nr:cupin domain-containing protein [Chitinophagaceae bacterium]